jgi:hypothetical protein
MVVNGREQIRVEQRRAIQLSTEQSSTALDRTSHTSTGTEEYNSAQNSTNRTAENSTTS